MKLYKCLEWAKPASIPSRREMKRELIQNESSLLQSSTLPQWWWCSYEEASGLNSNLSQVMSSKVLMCSKNAR